jgi:hypothetical protein
LFIQGEPMREPFDDVTKSFFRRLFESWHIAVESERVVFFRGRAIDLVVHCTEADLERLQDTVFDHFRQFNSLEFKGVHDLLTLVDLNRIIMRVWGRWNRRKYLEEPLLRRNGNARPSGFPASGP